MVSLFQQRKDKWDPNVLWVPVYAIMGINKALQLSKATYVSAVASAQQALADDKTDSLTAKLQVRACVKRIVIYRLL